MTGSADVFVRIFKFCCITGASIMIGYWAYKYRINKDDTLLEYIPVEDVDDLIYPIPSICIPRPFIRNDSLEVTHNGGFQNEYLNYLKGKGHFERYKNVSYDDVTPDITAYFQALTIIWKSETKHEFNYCTDLKTDFCQYLKIKNNYNGFGFSGNSGLFVKCYTFEIMNKYVKDIKQYYLTFSPTIENVLSKLESIYVDLIYPNQFLRPRVDATIIWSGSNISLDYELFQMASIEILKRRNKHNRKCLTNWKDYDTLALESFLRSVGCRPPYIENYHEIPFCNTKERIKEAHYDGFGYVKAKSVLDPCQEMPFINYKHDFIKPDPGDKAYVLSISYPPMAKIITQSQAVDAHSLIGNIGGYIGLFLGKLKLNSFI